MIAFRLYQETEGKLSDGNKLIVPKYQALSGFGPAIQVCISRTQGDIDNLIKHGIPIPEKVFGYALIDTGSNHSSIVKESANKLMLELINTVELDFSQSGGIRDRIQELLRIGLRN